MKISRSIPVLAVAVLFCLTGQLRAQNTSNATVDEGATIAQPLLLTNYGSLEFGAIICSATAAGTAAINGTANGNAGTTGSSGFTETYSGVVAYTGTHISGSTAASIAGFTVTGEPQLAYTISYPSSTTVTSGSNTMTVDNFAPVPETVDGMAPSGSLSGYGSETSNSSCGGNGEDAWTVGGTLHVAKNQPSGVYAGSFSVTITYN